MIITKARWWIESVDGLRIHVALYKEMLRAAQTLPAGQHRPRALDEQLERQRAMIGSCLLDVLLVHPVGSGRFY